MRMVNIVFDTTPIARVCNAAAQLGVKSEEPALNAYLNACLARGHSVHRYKGSVQYSSILCSGFVFPIKLFYKS